MQIVRRPKFNLFCRVCVCVCVCVCPLVEASITPYLNFHASKIKSPYYYQDLFIKEDCRTTY